MSWFVEVVFFKCVFCVRWRVFFLFCDVWVFFGFLRCVYLVFVGLS